MTEDHEVEGAIDVSQLARTIWRGKWLIVTLAVLFGAAGFFYATEVAKPVYVSSATVAIEGEQAQVTNLDSLVGGLSAEQPSLNTQVHIIQSRQLLRRLVLDQQLIDDPEFNPMLAEVSQYSISGLRSRFFGSEGRREYSDSEIVRIAVDRLRDRLTVTNPRQSFVFVIGIAADSSEKAAVLANALAMTYIDDQLLFKEEQSASAIDFLAERTLDLQLELNEAELEMKDFAASIELISAETLAAKNRQVKELRERLVSLDATIAAQQALSDVYQNFTIDTATAADVMHLENPRLTSLFTQGFEGQQQRSQFRSELGLATVRAQNELAQFQVQRGSLEAAVIELEDEVSNESRDLLILQQLQREADAVGEIYGYFLTRLKEAEVQQGTLRSDARLLSAAVEPHEASSPIVSLIVVFGVLVGAFIGATIVLLRENRNGGFRTAADLQKTTGQVVLGQIPLAPFKRRNKFLPYLRGENNTPFSEAVRNLRTSLLLAVPGKEPAVILLTSSVPGEGKTTTSIALAHSLVGMGKSVLLIEGDIRKNTLGEYFDRIEESSVDDTEISSDTTTFADVGFDLKFWPDKKVNPADFFSSPKFKKILDELRGRYDHIIIDAPPILPVTDARIIGQYADAILYAITWDDTRAEVINAGLSEFENADLRLTGLILTKIDGKKAKSYGGSARYGSYYGQYASGYYSN